jgi:predicted Holliday junction resolvase-like endonuclease
METAAIIAAAVVIAILIVILSSHITRLRYEKRFRDWQETELLRWQTELEHGKKSAVVQSRAVLGGKFTEQMAPYLPEFSYDPTEARFIGTPVDMVVFPGLAQGNPEEIVILEIKSGRNLQLTPQQKKIRQLIEEGMVRWEEIHRPSPEDEEEEYFTDNP